jgi:hypothetical protein
LNANVVYTSGNAGNGGNPQPDSIIVGAGAQILTPQVRAQSGQHPGIPTPVGSFNITQLGKKADKTGKDTNFRGLTIFDNVIYTSKGSGGNGINSKKSRLRSGIFSAKLTGGLVPYRSNPGFPF